MLGMVRPGQFILCEVSSGYLMLVQVRRVYVSLGHDISG